MDLDLAGEVDKVRSSVWEELVLGVFPCLSMSVCVRMCVLAAIRMGQYTTACCTCCQTSVAGQLGLLLRLLHFSFTPSVCELLCVCVSSVWGGMEDTSFNLRLFVSYYSGAITVILNTIFTTIDKQRYRSS